MGGSVTFELELSWRRSLAYTCSVLQLSWSSAYLRRSREKLKLSITDVWSWRDLGFILCNEVCYEDIQIRRYIFVKNYIALITGVGTGWPRGHAHQISNMSCRFVLWEAVSQTKYRCSLKEQILAPSNYRAVDVTGAGNMKSPRVVYKRTNKPISYLSMKANRLYFDDLVVQVSSSSGQAQN